MPLGFFYRAYIEAADFLGQFRHFKNIKYCNSWTQNFSPFVFLKIYFMNIFVFFGVQIFHILS